MQVALPQENLCWLIYNGTSGFPFTLLSKPVEGDYIHIL